MSDPRLETAADALQAKSYTASGTPITLTRDEARTLAADVLAATDATMFSPARLREVTLSLAKAVSKAHARATKKLIWIDADGGLNFNATEIVRHVAEALTDHKDPQ